MYVHRAKFLCKLKQQRRINVKRNGLTFTLCQKIVIYVTLKQRFSKHNIGILEYSVYYYQIIYTKPKTVVMLDLSTFFYTTMLQL